MSCVNLKTLVDRTRLSLKLKSKVSTSRERWCSASRRVKDYGETTRGSQRLHSAVRSSKWLVPFSVVARDAGGFDSLPLHVNLPTSLITKRYKYRKAMGIELYEQMWKTKRKIEYFFDLGFSCESIASGTDTAQATVHNWLTGAHPRIEIVNANKVRALTVGVLFDRAPDKSKVPVYATRRRVEALRRLGWTTRDIEARMIVSCKVSNTLKNSKQVRASVHRDIARVYAELEHKKGSSLRGAMQSARQLIPPPAAWEDIDDPRGWPRGVTNEILI